MNHFAVHLKLTQYCKSKKPKNQKTNPPPKYANKKHPITKKKKVFKIFCLFCFVFLFRMGWSIYLFYNLKTKQ